MSKVQKPNLQKAMTDAAADLKRHGFKTKVHSSPLLPKIAAKLSMGETINAVVSWHEKMREDNPELPKLSYVSMKTFSQKYLDEYIDLNKDVVTAEKPVLQKLASIYAKHQIDAYEVKLRLLGHTIGDLERVRKAEENMPSIIVSNARIRLTELTNTIANEMIELEIRMNLRTATAKAEFNLNFGEGSNVNISKFESYYEEKKEESKEETYKQVYETGQRILELMRQDDSPTILIDATGEKQGVN